VFIWFGAPFATNSHGVVIDRQGFEFSEFGKALTMRKTRKHQPHGPNAGNEPIPPGATRAAADRPIHQGGGAPGSGAGPRHAANDPGSPDESYEAVDSNDPLAEPPTDEPGPLELGPPYAGISGGAVGGTPAGGRSAGGNVDRPIYVASPHRGDSTIGSRPGPRQTPTRRSGPKSKKK
jgi:hypothetical protein